MLLDETVEVVLYSKNIKYYEGLGYKIPRRKGKNGLMSVPLGTKITIKTEDLIHGSEHIVNVKCDYCNREFTMEWNDYYRRVVNGTITKCTCTDCKYLKAVESNLKVYGVANPLSVPEIHKKQEDSKRKNDKIVIELFKSKGFIPHFEAKDYKNGNVKMPCHCINHPDIIQYKTLNGLQCDEGCRLCWAENCGGENHWNWQGGRTKLNRWLRELKEIKKYWRNNVANTHKTCYITGKSDNLVCHHVHMFQDIIDVVLDNIGIKYKGEVYNYSEDELMSIKKEFIKEHNKYEGVMLKEEIHNLYHYIYGFENISKSTVNEFKLKYLNGEYNDVDLSYYKYSKL